MGCWGLAETVGLKWLVWSRILMTRYSFVLVHIVRKHKVFGNSFDSAEIKHHQLLDSKKSRGTGGSLLLS